RYSCVTRGPHSMYWTSRQDTRGLSDAPHAGHERNYTVGLLLLGGPLGQMRYEDLRYAATVVRARIARFPVQFKPNPSTSSGPCLSKPSPRLGNAAAGQRFAVNVNTGSPTVKMFVCGR